MRVKVNQDERALLYKDGDFERLLKPGKYVFSPFANYSVERFDVNLPFAPSKNLNLYLKDKELVEELDVVEVADKEIVLRYEDGRFVQVLTAGKYAFWKALKTNRFETVDLSNPEVLETIEKAVLVGPAFHRLVQVAELASFERGLLLYNGEFQKVLKPGKYFFWNGPVKVVVQKVDMRQLQTDISGQEIMTRDKVTLRINFVVQYRIVDPIKAVIDINDYQAQLYVLTQLILREYVGMFTLEELLQKKEEIGTFVLEKMAEQGEAMGLQFIFAGVKDVILPGEMKAILAQVIEAEKRAQANLITRREETASTRSLLNTARLMENNPTLMKLKELEYIERISDKIANLSISPGAPLLSQLNKLFGVKEPE